MNCQNCGSNKLENFCPSCGEKRFHEHALTLPHLAEETLEGFSHFDNKFFRTLRTLLFEPAKLSLAYCNGITVRFMKPVSFFLVTNLLFFFLSAFNPFSLPLYNYTHYSPFVNFGTKEAVIAKLTETKMSDVEYGRLFNEHMKTNSKTFIILFIPFLELLFALFFIRRKQRFGEHFIMAMHLMCFVMWLFLIQGWIVALLGEFITFTNVDGVISMIDLLIVSTYLFFSIRKFYSQKTAVAIPVSLIICILFALAIHAYRLGLFFKIVEFS